MSKVSGDAAAGAGSRTRRKFTEEFKQDAVQMLLDGHSASSICQRLGLTSPNLLYRWKRRTRPSFGCGKPGRCCWSGQLA